MNCIIIDDDEISRVLISNMIIKSEELNLSQTFTSAVEALKFLNENTIDLIFLDIHMPNFNGFDFIKTLKDPPNVILITSDKNFAIQAFEYECIVDYLVKPINYDRFLKSIIKLKSKSKIESKTEIKEETASDLYVNIDKKLIKINYNSISIIEAKGDYIYIITDKKSYIVHSTLKKIEEKLPKNLFIKIHRSYIINFSKIIDIEDNTVVIDKYVIPISRTNKQELINKLNLL
ncbi:MAG: LytR/AlgR family response regulator transcription factor [Flavobacterium sp.]|jgi:two-component system response regulator LytT